jgi:small conductance mechanosensitive channel
MEDSYMNSWSHLFETEMVELLVAAVKGGVILVGGWLAARFVSRCMAKTLGKTKAKKDLLIFLDNISFYAILTLSTMAALSEMGVDTNSFLAVLGGAALAIGLGLKDQLAQLTAGIVLLIKHPFRIGNVVTLAGQTGKVESIDFFQTTLKSKDGKKIILPNSLAMGSVITNYSGYPERRIDLPVVISYQDDIALAKQTLLEVASRQPLVKPAPPSQAVMSDMKDHGVELTLRCWVSSSDYGKARADLMEQVKTEIERQGLTIPFPQLVLHSTQDGL